jgi:cytoskeletal protein CcmA (bactofilin family)
MWNKHEEESVRPPTAPSPATPVTAPPAPMNTASPERRDTACLGASITIVGDVTGDDDLTILGRLEGKVDLPKNSVTIGPGAKVKADIRAKAVSVAGEVTGNIVATEQVVIRKTATMLGNLAAPRVGLEDGCCFRGSVEMEAPAAKGRPASAPAPATGGGTAVAPSGGTAPKHEPAVRP